MSDFRLFFGDPGGVFDPLLGGDPEGVLGPLLSGWLFVVETGVRFGSSKDLNNLSSEVFVLFKVLFLSSAAWATRASKSDVGFDVQACLPEEIKK